MQFTSRARHLMRAGLAVATIVAVCAPASAGASDDPEGAPPTTLPAVPGGTGSGAASSTTPVVDDMRTLTLEVPAAWSEIVTTPGTGSDGSQFPQIVASPNVTSFQNSFDTPGAMYAAQPLSADTEAGVTAAFDFTGQCTDGGKQPYTDAYFSGTMQTWTQCGGGQAKVVTVFANPLDQRFSVVLLVGIATPADEDALSLALASFFVTKPQGAPAPGATASTGTVAANVPVSTAAVPAVPGATPTTAPVIPAGGTGPVTPGATGDPVILEDDTEPIIVEDDTEPIIVEDDTKTIGVGVPPAWTQINTSPASDAQNQQVPAIAAAPDLAAFNSGQGVGVFMVAAPYTADLQSVLTTMAPQGCQGQAATPYQDEFFTGLTQTFPDCGGVTVTLLAANRNGNTTRTMQIIVATTPGDDAPLQIVASTFDFTPEAR